MSRILAIGSDPQAVRSLLHHLDGDLVATDSAAEGLVMHEHSGASLVLVSLPIHDRRGSDLLTALRRQEPRGSIIAIGHDESIRGVSDALRFGATEYLPDLAVDAEVLRWTIERSLGVGNAEAQLRFLRRKDAEGADWQTIVGRSHAMREVFSTVRRLCERTHGGASPPVLLQGETGTGKGLIAKAVHYNGARRSRAFVDLNCAALPPSLIEAELFGHVRGAFTDAHVPRAGLFETANQGTLFLDEIGSLPLDLQGKLLKAIEEKVVRRIGASEDVRVDVQIIAATQRDLASMVRDGTFRDDLFHRLNVVTIQLPPLRSRHDDRALLARTFLDAFCREYGVAAKRLTDDALRAIDSYAWPGNVRELRNRIERVVLLEDTDEIRGEHLLIDCPSGVVVDGGGDELSVQLPPQPFSLDALEKTVIRDALERHSGNVSRTARYLGLSRYALMYRIKKHQLASPTA